MAKIGIWKSVKILGSILYSRMAPIKEEKSLEDFYINRFGHELYTTFFKDYTEKVWGKSCREISPEWGRQRVKGLNFKKIVKHYFTTLFYPMRQSFGNNDTEQTLTEYFLYPQKGPGQLWDMVTKACKELNVDIRLEHKVKTISTNGNQVNQITVEDSSSNREYTIECDKVISTMPIKNLMQGLDKDVPEPIFKIACNLEYRDFMIVGLLLDKLELKDRHEKSINDNWLYIQDLGIKVGRVQLFHNWSPDMVAKQGTCWIGAEYFCQKGDELWNMTDEKLIEFASMELESIGVIDSSRVKDGTVVRMPKAYPSYVGSYAHFDQVKEFFDTIKNLYLIGRNGTHRYNNQDHSMLTALEAVTNIMQHNPAKDNIWEVNTEMEYHEEIESSHA